MLERMAQSEDSGDGRCISTAKLTSNKKERSEMTTLCTFNVNNLFLRYKFGKTFPGDMSGKSASPDFRWAYLPMYKAGLFEVFSPAQRKLAAQVLYLPNGSLPDIICVQEVESLQALRAFNEHYLGAHYAYAALVDSRDLRQIDVGILSTKPIVSLKSNVDLVDTADAGFPWLFSRDCLEVTIDLNESGSKLLTVFINHFKSKLVQGDTPKERETASTQAAEKRKRQAKTVTMLLNDRFQGKDYGKQLFAVVGDLNDEPRSDCLKSLVRNANLENVLDRLPSEERWTHYYKSDGQVSQFDYLLLSPALSRASGKASPTVNRAGLGFRELSKKDQGVLPQEVRLVTKEGASGSAKVAFRFKRLPDVSPSLVASDHCSFTIEF
jgi:hypothetical protein